MTTLTSEQIAILKATEELADHGIILINAKAGT